MHKPHSLETEWSKISRICVGCTGGNKLHHRSIMVSEQKISNALLHCQIFLLFVPLPNFSHLFESILWKNWKGKVWLESKVVWKHYKLMRPNISITNSTFTWLWMLLYISKFQSMLLHQMALKPKSKGSDSIVWNQRIEN